MRHQFKRATILFAAFFILIIGCSESNNTQDTSLEGLPDGFADFYYQFHHDSAFQMEHIVFPLDGIRSGTVDDSLAQNENWKAEEWVLHQPIESIDDYNHTFNVLGDDMVIETIEEKELPITMQRRFALMSDGWHLIYYVEMQLMSTKDRTY